MATQWKITYQGSDAVDLLPDEQTVYEWIRSLAHTHHTDPASMDPTVTVWVRYDGDPEWVRYEDHNLTDWLPASTPAEYNPATVEHYTHGGDLDWMLHIIDGYDPIDVDADTTDVPAADWAVYNTLGALRADILRRQAVQAGPRDVDYCGVGGGHGRACGPELGLPVCAAHAAEDRDAAPPFADARPGGARAVDL